ncbi:hypothetical protein ACVW00_004232 [Marmoricola sp. URHA0025 HA25]
MALRSTALAGTAAPTYDEYVAARWTALYRTAYLLTANHADAEDLAQTTLVKAYLSWSKVAAAGSPDAYVRRILTNAFVSSRRTLRVARERLVEETPELELASPVADDRLVLWPHVSALSTQAACGDRAALLRGPLRAADRRRPRLFHRHREVHGQRRTEGAAIPDDAHRRRRVMNIEETLTDELATVARSVEPPPPPAVATLVQEAGRTRRRTGVRWATTTFLTAAAVLAAVFAGTELGGPDAAPQPTRPTPTKKAETFSVGTPLRTYVDPANGDLYIDGTRQPGSWDDATTLGDLTLGFGRTRTASGSNTVGVFRGGRRVGTLHDLADYDIKTSPDTGTIAWVEDHDKTGVIVVDRVSADGVRELGRLTVRTLLINADDESHENLISVADDGTVTYGGVLGGHAWRPGGSPHDADISSYLYGPQGFPSHADYVQPNPASTWGAWLTDQADPGDGGGEVSWSAVAFQQPGRPETKVRIAMPAPYADVRGLYWESDTDFILATFNGDTTVHVEKGYVRCDVVTRSCEVAPGWGDH